MSYIYFDINGRLREYVTTPKRKGSENVDTLCVYWEGNDGTVVLPSQCFIEYGHESIHAGPLTANKISRTIIPFERERDLKFFQYGKTYQFMCFDLPTAVSSTSGFWHSSVSIHDRLSNNVVQVLGDITFEVEESSIVPSGNLDLSQYNYILDKVDQTLAKYDSKLDRKAPTSIVDSNENSIVDFHDNEATFYKPVHVNNELWVRNDTGIIIEGDDGSGKFSSILDDYDLNEFSFITDRKAFYWTFREDVTKGLVFDSSQTLSLRNGTEFLNDANTKTVFGQAIKGSSDIHTWDGTPTNPKDITTKEYVDTKVSTETDGVVKRGDLKTLNGESLLGNGDITYDTSLSPTSTNAVQNKVVNSTISELSYQLAMVRENLFQTVLSEIDYTEDFATLYPIPDTLSDTDGTHRVLFSETQLREVAGNSVAFNQLNPNDKLSGLINSVDFTQNNDGSWTINGTASANAFKIISSPIPLISGHKYLLKGAYGGSSSTYSLYEDAFAKYDNGEGIIFTASSSTNTALGLKVNNGANISNKKVYPQLFDLTLMGLDSITTVEEFNRIFPNDYYPYNAGEIRNTTASGIKVNGYNAWDEDYRVGLIQYDKNQSNFGQDISGSNVCSKNYIKVAPGRTYSLEPTSTQKSGIIFCYDANKTPIIVGERGYIPVTGNPTTLPNNCSYIKFYMSNPYGSVYKNDICFHLSTLRTGYAPYKEPKAISFASTELLGAGEAHDTIEVVEGDKVAGIQRYNLVQVKRVGTVDLGTLSWVSYTGISDKSIYQAPLNDMKLNAGLTCSKLVQVKAVYDSGDDYSISSHPTLAKVYARTSDYEETETAFKDAMSGVILNYELATPTRTTIAENLTFEEVSATIEQGGSIETIYETLAPNCTTGFVVKKATEVSK